MATVSLAAVLALAAGCGNEGSRGTLPGPSGSPSQHSAEPALPDPVPDQLTRILGDGSGTSFSGAGPASETSVSTPAGLTTGTHGELLGLQGGTVSATSQVFSLDTEGELTPVPDLRNRATPFVGPGSGHALATYVVDEGLLVVHRGDDVELLDLESGERRARTPLPHTATASATAPWAAGLLPPLGADADATLQYGDEWFDVHLDGERIRLVPRSAPVRGAVASAAAGPGAVVLDDRGLVRLDAQGRPGGRVDVELPETGGTVTSMAAGPDDRVFLTLASPPRGRSGSVVEVAPDGAVRVLARGRAPAGVGARCEADSSPALRSELTLPVSVQVWAGRVVVADSECGAIYQLALAE